MRSDLHHVPMFTDEAGTTGDPPVWVQLADC